MSIDNRLIVALQPIISEIQPNQYTGEADEYIVFNYNSIPELFAESTAAGIRELVQVHYYLPSGKNPNAIKKRIAAALNAAGATYPSVTNASDNKMQHYVFECEMLETNG